MDFLYFLGMFFVIYRWIVFYFYDRNLKFCGVENIIRWKYEILVIFVWIVVMDSLECILIYDVCL